MKNVPKLRYIPIVLLLLFSIVFMSSRAGEQLPFDLVPTKIESQEFKQALTFEYDKKKYVVNLLTSFDGAPSVYFANIITPICEDRVCEVVNLRLFWDLSGSYICFDTIAGFPLTKLAHKPFSQKDYLKLHYLLKDKSSVLKDKDYNELVVEDVKSKSLGVDAISSATVLEVKDAVVHGAVYSSYSLWHIVNGVSASKIKEHTLSISDRKIIDQLLKSENPNNLLLGLQMLDSSELYKINEKVLFLIKEANPAIQEYLLTNISDDFISVVSNQEEISKNFDLLSAENREILFTRLISCDYVSSRSLMFLSNNLMNMSYLQVKNFVTLLRKNENRNNSQIKKNINAVVNSTNFKYDYLLKHFANAN